MKKWLKDNLRSYDIVHLHTFRSYQNVLICDFCNIYRIPFIVQAHGSVPYIGKQWLKIFYDHIWGRKTLATSSKLIAITRTESDYYRMIGVNKSRIEIIPNGINLSEYKDFPAKGEFRKRYSIGNDEKVALYIGRLHKSKNIDLLIDAFGEILKKRNDVKLLIAGTDSGYKLKLEELIRALGIKENVVFTGFISNHEKFCAFIDADVFVTPSFSGFPITFLEACATGTPLVTTVKGDNLGWVHKNVGYVVEDNKYKLAEAIINIINNEQLKQKFGDIGKFLVENEFNWDKIINSIITTYSECIANWRADENLSYR